MPEDELVCPECGGPIGQTSTFCMHCSADLADRHPSRNGAAEDQSTSGDGWMEVDAGVVDVEQARADEQEVHQQDLPPEYRSTSGAVDRSLLPDDFAIKAVTFLLAMAGGLAVGISSAIAISRTVGGTVTYLLAVLAWTGSTAVFLRVVPG